MAPLSLQGLHPPYPSPLRIRLRKSPPFSTVPPLLVEYFLCQWHSRYHLFRAHLHLLPHLAHSLLEDPVEKQQRGKAAPVRHQLLHLLLHPRLHQLHGSSHCLTHSSRSSWFSGMPVQSLLTTHLSRLSTIIAVSCLPSSTSIVLQLCSTIFATCPSRGLFCLSTDG